MLETTFCNLDDTLHLIKPRMEDLAALRFSNAQNI